MERQALERLHPLYELLRADAASMKAGASIRYTPTKWLRLASARRDAHSSHGCLLSADSVEKLAAVSVVWQNLQSANEFGEHRHDGSSSERARAVVLRFQP